MVGEISQFFPEIGETTQLGYQKAMQKMAKDIVSMMESSWGDEYRVDIDEVKPDDPITDPAKTRRNYVW